MIRVSGLVHRYRESVPDGEGPAWKTALDGVNLDVTAGQFVVILGTNGSGKSTLARHLNVLLRPDAGTVSIDGMDTMDDAKLWEIRERVGMVFQNPDNQIIGTTVEEDCAFGLEMRAAEPAEIRSRVREMLETVGLADKAKASPDRLSGGQKQRLAIAGVTVCRPRCIVLDEPTAMLDPTARREVLTLLHQLNRHQKITVILITHHADEAVDADRILVMERGRVAMDGSPAEVFSDLERIRELGLEAPQITSVADALRQKGFQFSCPVLTPEQFAREFAQLRHDGKGGGTGCL
jgi:energy-coupling factor transporter ATPase